MNDQREVLTWELFGSASRELAKTVAADGFEPDLLLSIARGGLFVAGALGYALDVKNLHVMNVEFSSIPAGQRPEWKTATNWRSGSSFVVTAEA